MSTKARRGLGGKKNRAGFYFFPGVRYQNHMTFLTPAAGLRTAANIRAGKM
jgi:hypothetical protein